MSQEQKFNTGDASQGSNIPSNNVPRESISAPSDVEVDVQHGSYRGRFKNLQGRTVGFVKKALRDHYSIPGDAEAVVNGDPVGDDFVLQGAVHLQFLKEHGVKGRFFVISDI